MDFIYVYHELLKVLGIINGKGIPIYYLTGVKVLLQEPSLNAASGTILGLQSFNTTVYPPAVKLTRKQNTLAVLWTIQEIEDIDKYGVFDGYI